MSIAILETPAGFQPNSEVVAAEVREFMQAHLQNHRPRISIVPARKKGETLGPENSDLLKPLLDASYIFMGPGSPTYAVRNLKDTLAWRSVLERHLAGAYLCFASAGTIAVGAKVLPVYEIFKAGADPHWVDGLNLLGRYGLELALVPHWNNAEGGARLDTSHCFMGKDRMERLQGMLPQTTRLLALDEHTAAVFDFGLGRCSVLGRGTATIWGAAGERRFVAGEDFPLNALGPYSCPPATATSPSVANPAPAPLPAQVERLVSEREEARRRRDWARADALRAQVAQLGFELKDTPHGVEWRHLGPEPSTLS